MDEHDDVLQHARAVLVPVPPTNPAAVARILAAVDAAESVAEDVAEDVIVRPFRASRSRGPRWFAGAAALAAAAALAVVTIRAPRSIPDDIAPSVAVREGEANRVSGETNVSAAAGETPYPAVLEPATEGTSMDAVPVFFGFVASARTVSLVGDFNDWNVDSMPLTRVDGTDRWVTSARIVPGRHVYAFVVDGERWVRDPLAPVAPDDDFGKPGSVLMVTPE